MIVENQHFLIKLIGTSELTGGDVAGIQLPSMDVGVELVEGSGTFLKVTHVISC